jgi:hypothetical protein
MKAMTLEDAKNLRVGQTIHMINHQNADGTPVRWRVNGAVKTWKTKPDLVQVPLKHGLRDYGYLTQDNLGEFSLTAE